MDHDTLRYFLQRTLLPHFEPIHGAAAAIIAMG
jgi:hypothetical protein